MKLITDQTIFIFLMPWWLSVSRCE